MTFSILFQPRLAFFSWLTIVLKSRAAYSSSVLYNCAFLTTLWIQISLSTCFHSINRGRNESTNLLTETYLVSDIERENGRKDLIFQILTKNYFSDIKGENGTKRWTQRDLLSGTLKSFPMGKGGKVILRGRMNIWSLIGGLSKVFRWIASHLECWKFKKVHQVWLSLAPLGKKCISVSSSSSLLWRSSVRASAKLDIPCFFRGPRSIGRRLIKAGACA